MAPARPRPPNVVFILIDDLGWMDLGVQGSTFYETLNIDALAGNLARLLLRPPSNEGKKDIHEGARRTTKRHEGTRRD